MSDLVPLTALVEVNPRSGQPRVGEAVSFVGMEAVTETGMIAHTEIQEAMPGYTPFQEGDVLLAKITPCLENGKGAHAVGLPRAKAQGSTEFHVLRARPGVSARFIYHWTRTEELRRAAEAMMTGSAGQRRVPTHFFERFCVPHFTLEEQRLIAESLDTVDRAIRTAEHTLEKSKAYYRGVLDSLLDQVFQSSERLSCGALFEIRSGITLNSSRKPRRHSVGYLRVGNVYRGALQLDDIAVLEATREEQRRLGVQIGDLLVVEGHANPDEIGRCALVGRRAEGLLYQNHLFRLRSEHIDPYFALEVLNSWQMRSYWRRNCATSSGLYTINSRQLAELPFPNASLSEQKQIAQFARQCRGAAAREVAFIDKLRALRKGLGADLLYGNVRVESMQ